MKRVLVTGSSGFIGSHLVARLQRDGYWVRGVDSKSPRWSFPDDFCLVDLRKIDRAHEVVRGVDWVVGLAASMGGAGYIFTGDNDLEIMRDNTLINLNTLEAARVNDIRRYLFSSSACVYPQGLQRYENVIPLKEIDAYPANPDSSYGWEKLYMERLIAAYQERTSTKYRVARFHNIFGPLSTWTGGREKAPAALCRKVAIAKLTGNPEIEIWGDGQQCRSFMYIDDCIEGMLRLMRSDFPGPLNLGRDRVVTINELADIIADIAGIQIVKKHIEGPQGVRSRNSDNSLCKEVLGWAPSIPLEEGFVPTYKWIEEQVRATCL